MRARPRHHDRVEHITTLLEKLDDTGDLGDRIERASAMFLGFPYLNNPLAGGPEEKEVLTVSLEGFDCVTYIETVLALALAHRPAEFVDLIRSIRYRNGEIDWFERNHYMTDWARNNRRAGFINDLTRGPDSVARRRTLGVVPGIREKTISFRCFPKPSFARVRRLALTGDLVLFVSTKPRLDVFHAGMLIARNGEVLLRHATRSAGKVVEQRMREFLSNNRMTGFILLRPICRH